MDVGRKQQGMSLIEVMIALALGVLMLLGLVQIFSSVRVAFSTTEGLSRVQENARFALDFLRRDIRMAGHVGCLNESGHPFDVRGVDEDGNPVILEKKRYFHHLLAADEVVADIGLDDADLYSVRVDRAVEVYDYDGTSTGDAFDIPDVADATAAGDWVPDLPAALDLAGAGTGAVVGGSDVVVVRYFDETLIPLTAPGVGGTSPDRTLAVDAAAAGDVQQYGLYGLTNCRTASLLQVTGVAPITVSETSSLNLRPFDSTEGPYSVGAMMYRYRAVAYYVGRSARGPSLFRRRLIDAPASADEGAQFGPPEELVEGVETLQVILGVDTAGSDDLVDGYRSASDHVDEDTDAQQVADLAQIRSLRVALLLRSQGTDRAAVGIDGPDEYVVGDVTMTPAADQRIRQTYESQITIRNRVRN